MEVKPAFTNALAFYRSLQFALWSITVTRTNRIFLLCYSINLLMPRFEKFTLSIPSDAIFCDWSFFPQFSGSLLLEIIL